MTNAAGPVLVTGASGLIGRQLVTTLRAAGSDCLTTTASPSDGDRPAVDRPGVDLAAPGAALDLVRWARPATVVHLAGGVAADVDELYRRNALTTVHLLEAVAEAQPLAHCIVLGSAAEYGAGGERALDEAAPERPVSDYGRAKLAQTRLARSIASARGLRLLVLRPFNLVSPQLPSTTALGNMRRQLLAASEARPRLDCGRLDVVRDYVSVSLVAHALVTLVRQPLTGTLNVCSGTGIELGSILTAMAKRLGKEPAVTTQQELARQAAADRVVGDPTRLRGLLGSVPQLDAEAIAREILG